MGIVPRRLPPGCTARSCPRHRPTRHATRPRTASPRRLRRSRLRRPSTVQQTPTWSSCGGFARTTRVFRTDFGSSRKKRAAAAALLAPARRKRARGRARRTFRCWRDVADSTRGSQIDLLPWRARRGQTRPSPASASGPTSRIEQTCPRWGVRLRLARESWSRTTSWRPSSLRETDASRRASPRASPRATTSTNACTKYIRPRIR
jgi:hypothetical protein